MGRIALLGIVCFSRVAVGRAQAPPEFVGKIEKELVPGRMSSVKIDPSLAGIFKVQ